MDHPRILAVGTATPPRSFTQEELLALSGYPDARRRHFFTASEIESRHLAIDPATFDPGEPLDALNARFAEFGPALAQQAATVALERAGVEPGAVDFVATTTCTGRLCPSLDTLLIRDLKLREDVQRVHVGDTGCASGMVALQQASHYLRAHPGRRALVVAAEICSAAYVLDGALETAVANAIFADGAAAALLGPGGSGPALVEHHTLFRPEYLPLMGFTFPGGRPRILLSKDIRHIGGEMMEALAARILAAHRLRQEAIRFWVLHSAGRRVIEHARARLGLGEADVAFSRGVLRRYGNMSSATVLFVLEAVMASGRPSPGDYGVMVALGPGFAAEGALLRW
jgi:predicted naringenin-chalcone synthase